MKCVTKVSFALMLFTREAIRDSMSKMALMKELQIFTLFSRWYAKTIYNIYFYIIKSIFYT